MSTPEQALYVIVIRNRKDEVVTQSIYSDLRHAEQDFETDRLTDGHSGDLCGPFAFDEGFDISSSLRGGRSWDSFDNR